MYTEIRFTLNGEQKLYQGDPLRRLLDVLREDYGLTGSKDGIPEEFFPDGSFYVKKYECSDSLFVTKENQQEFGPDKSFVPLIVLTLPMDDEFRAAYDRASSLEHTDASEYDIIESGSAFDRFVELNASKKSPKAPFM